LAAPLRAQLEPEGIVHVAERVRARQQFSGSIPGMVSGWGVNRHLGLIVFTRERLLALLPSSTARPRSRFRIPACAWTST
jgi:hypothetical protein